MLVHVNFMGFHSHALSFFIINTSFSCVICSKFWISMICVLYTYYQAFYGDETWTLRKVDQKYLGSIEMWCCRRIKIISTNR
jgi:uncharacterized membrane protein